MTPHLTTNVAFGSIWCDWTGDRHVVTEHRDGRVFLRRDKDGANIAVFEQWLADEYTQVQP